MADQVDVDLGRLPHHAADHQSIAAQWQQWPAGGDAFLAELRRSHGVVAEPIARVLEQYQLSRAQFAGNQSDMHHSVSDAITASCGAFRSTEADNSDRLSVPVREL